jgi:hypothetical protein
MNAYENGSRMHEMKMMMRSCVHSFIHEIHEIHEILVSIHTCTSTSSSTDPVKTEDVTLSPSSPSSSSSSSSPLSFPLPAYGEPNADFGVEMLELPLSAELLQARVVRPKLNTVSIPDYDHRDANNFAVDGIKQIPEEPNKYL